MGILPLAWSQIFTSSLSNWWVSGFRIWSWSLITVPQGLFLTLFSDVVRLLCEVKGPVFLWHDFLKSVEFPVTNPRIPSSLLPCWSKPSPQSASKENGRVHSIGSQHGLLPCVKKPLWTDFLKHESSLIIRNSPIQPNSFVVTHEPLQSLKNVVAERVHRPCWVQPSHSADKETEI